MPCWLQVFDNTAVTCECRELADLNLGTTDMGPKGARLLAEAVKGSKALKILDLEDNPIGPEGTKFLSDAFCFDTALEKLKLGWCKVSARGGLPCP